MIQNIIFDLGNVLLHFEPEKLIEAHVVELERRSLLLRNIFQQQEWLDLDRGTITEQITLARIISRVPEEAEVIKEIFSEWIQILTPMEENVRLLPLLKRRGIKLYALSNFHRAAYEVVSEKYDFFSFFDGQIISCYVHQLKPEKEIYNTILHSFKLKPHETLFVDDSIVNIEGARELGIQTVHYTPEVRLADVIKKYIDGTI